MDWKKEDKMINKEELNKGKLIERILEIKKGIWKNEKEFYNKESLMEFSIGFLENELNELELEDYEEQGDAE